MLGHPHASEQEMIQALRISGAIAMVQQDAACLDRIINEGGQGLSGYSGKSVIYGAKLMKLATSMRLEPERSSLKIMPI